MRSLTRERSPHVSVLLKMSQTYAPTLKETPSEAEIVSHQLLLRAGMIRRHAAGIYTYLPLAWRSLRKIEQIVREEMDRIGSQELLLPIMQPAELWQESGRWDDYGPELMRFHDRHDREFALGPTHEEIITTLVDGELRSYRDLPVSMYQIQTKFRDEIRPRFGLLRGREFIMKDAYSFHASRESLAEHYDEMTAAYGRICERLGLKYYPVEADSGQIGGSETIEFLALAESGEADLVHCDCGYAANVEVASAGTVHEPGVESELAEVETPGIGSIAALAEFLKIEEPQTVKTMVGKDGSGQVYMFFIPGDYEINELKIDKMMSGFELLEDEEFAKLGMPKGFLGPVNAPEGVVLVADESLRDDPSWIVGANKVDAHFTGAKPGRDFEIDTWADLVLARAGDRCPECDATLQSARGIEVGQVFQLGDKYSVALGATYADEGGNENHFLMGCYGWGVSRSLAAVIEQGNDENGIVWPVSVAPAEVAVVPLAVDDDEVYPVAEKIASDLAAAGIEVVIDDRDERPGVKFNEADLLGWPFQVVVGKKGLANGIVEFKVRATGERSEIALDTAADAIRAIVEAERAKCLV